MDEYTVEQAFQLQVTEAAGEAGVTYLLMGPPAAGDAVRKALSMGGDKAVHVSDDALHGSDALATSLVLTSALRKIGFDLVLRGMASTDAGMGTAPPRGKPPGRRASTRGMHARLSGSRQAGTRDRRGPFVAVRGKPTVHTDRPGGRTPSAYLHRHVTASGVPRWAVTVLGRASLCSLALIAAGFLRAAGWVRGREAPAQRRRRRP